MKNKNQILSTSQIASLRRLASVGETTQPAKAPKAPKAPNMVRTMERGITAGKIGVAIANETTVFVQSAVEYGKATWKAGKVGRELAKQACKQRAEFDAYVIEKAFRDQIEAMEAKFDAEVDRDLENVADLTVEQLELAGFSAEESREIHATVAEIRADRQAQQA